MLHHKESLNNSKGFIILKYVLCLKENKPEINNKNKTVEILNLLNIKYHVSKSFINFHNNL
jgi:hypothetical protein